jgi:hypothetical protein
LCQNALKFIGPYPLIKQPSSHQPNLNTPKNLSPPHLAASLPIKLIKNLPRLGREVHQGLGHAVQLKRVEPSLGLALLRPLLLKGRKVLEAFLGGLEGLLALLDFLPDGLCLSLLLDKCSALSAMMKILRLVASTLTFETSLLAPASSEDLVSLSGTLLLVVGWKDIVPIPE